MSDLSPRPSPAEVRPGQDVAWLLILFAAIAAVFWPVHAHDFVDLDDLRYVHHNPILHHGLTPGAIVAAFTQSYEAYWIPLTWISLAADISFHGLRAGAFLLENVALHAASAGILFLTLVRMTGRRAPSAFVAALFALHPLHVESVAWVSERKDVLSGLFFMLTLHAWVKYAEGPPRFMRRLPALGWFALGLLSKPAIFPLPFALLLLDYWPLGRLARAGGGFDSARLRAAFVEKLPMIALSIAAAVIVFLTQRSGGGMEMADVLPASTKLTVSAESWGFYLWKTVWPSGLAALYPMPFDPPPAWRWLGSLVLMTAITTFVVRQFATRPWLAVGWAWFVVLLLPASGLLHVGVQARADRWTYLPMIGLGLALAWELDQRLKARTHRIALAAVAVAAIAALAVTAHAQVGWWKNSETLFRRALAVTTDNHYMADRMAQEFRRRGLARQAEQYHLETIRLVPGWGRPQHQLADIWAFFGDSTGAATLRAHAARVAFRDPAAVEATAVTFLEAGRAREALPILGTGIERRARSAKADRSDLARLQELRTIAAMDTLASHHARAGRFREATLHARSAATEAARLRLDWLAAAMTARADGYAKASP